MGGVLFYYSPPIDAWLALDTLSRAGHLCMWIAIGITTYFSILFVSGFRIGPLLRTK
jgi:hypothetical protein